MMLQFSYSVVNRLVAGRVVLCRVVLCCVVLPHCFVTLLPLVASCWAISISGQQNTVIGTDSGV